jgi:hypothetical protein
MVQVPDWTALPQATPQPQYRRVQVDDSAAHVWDQVSGVGSAIANAADAVHQKDVADASTWASNKLTDFRVQTMQAMQDAQANAADDAHGFTPDVLADFDKRADAFTGEASSNPLASQFIEKALPQLRAQVAETAMRWESQQRTAFREQSVIDNTNKLTPLVQQDPTQGPVIGGQLLAQINASGLEPDQRAALKTHVVSELTLAGGRGAADADPTSTLAQLNDPDDQTYAGLTPAQREGLQQYARGQVVDQQATSLAQVFKEQGAQAGYAALKAIDNDDSLAPDIRDDIRSKTNGLVSSLRTDQRSQNLQALSDLDKSIASGQAGPAENAEAWRLYNANALDPDQLLATVTAIDRSQRKAQDDAALLATGIKNFISGTPMDPKAADSKDQANAVFNALATKQPSTIASKAVDALGGAVPGLPESVPGTPGSDGYANAAVAVATHMGIVPPDVVSWGRANLVSGNPQSAAAAANLLSRLDETNPSAYGYAVDDPKTRAMVSTIANAVNAGADPAAAVELARRNASLPQPELQALEQKWKAAKPEDQQASQLSSILGSDPRFKSGWFSGVPTAPPLMQGQFDQLTRSYYDETGGNIAQARELAVQDLKRTWGVSEVNGDRQLMQYAPEVMFPGLSAAVVRNDVAKTVADNGSLFQNVDPSQVHLTATDRTARTGGLDWALMVPDKFGAYEPVVGKDGNPITYRLPVGNNDYAAVKAREAQAALESARQTQQLRQDAVTGQQLAIQQQGAM